MRSELLEYHVTYSACADEIRAESLDEACDTAESLLPAGQHLLSVEGPDGCRLFEDPGRPARAAERVAA